MSSRLANRRVRLLLGVFVVAFAVLFARAVWLQGVRASALARLATRQQHETVTIPAGRGTIFDRMGVQLALDEQATTIYADPRQIRDPRRLAQKVGRVLGLDPAKLYPELADRSRGFVYVWRKADPAKAAALEKLGLTGIGFYPEDRRTYPQGSVAAQVLGYAGVDNHGLAGLELSLDRKLSGRPGRETIVKDAFGRAIDVTQSTPVREGRDVFLTIDHSLQANAEYVLRQTLAKWHAKDATAVVLDPHTGSILAMVDAPGFNANDYPQAPAAWQRNRAVTDTYEPGSTFKLVTVAGVLSDHLVTPRTAFTLPGSIRVADRVIHDAEPRPTERFTVAQILSKSSNVGAITLAQMLGKDRLFHWIQRFRFGRTTGVDFPAESPGIVLPPDKWSGSTIGNVPIGQGIAVTPIQMAAAYAAIANGGIWVQPHLVDHIAGVRTPNREHTRIVSHEVDRELVKMLENVVAEGTGTYAAVPGYLVAGKTGTSQKLTPKGTYSNSLFVASFVGFVPADRPRLVILVSVDEPKGAIWGGVVAAPAFAEIARFGLQYLEVRPSQGAASSAGGAGPAIAPAPSSAN